MAEDLRTRFSNFESYLRDNERSLRDSVALAANISGIRDAVANRDTQRLRALLASALAVHSSLDLLVASDRQGAGLVESRRVAGELTPTTEGNRWGGFVDEILAGSAVGSEGLRSGLLATENGSFLADAWPVGQPEVVGAMIAGMSADRLATEANSQFGARVAIFDPEGRVVAAAGVRAGGSPPAASAGRPVLRVATDSKERIATLYGPLVLLGARRGTLAVSVPVQPFFASARGAAIRLVFLLALGMAAVVGIGALLSRYILGQLRSLVAASRSLERGDLAVRAPAYGKDELGELARRFNLMAEGLEASYRELESRVEQRTEELQHLYQEVKHAAQARAEFFAGISHEFRTPLFVILGHTEMMLEPGFHPLGRDWRQEYGSTIKDQAESLLSLVNQILDLAKLESQVMKLDLQDVELAGVVDELRKTIVPLGRKGELDVEIDVPSDLPRVRADPVRLRQVVLNLVSNSVKYTPPGGRVRVSASSIGDAVEISVSDTGVGVPKEALRHVFEPFYQVKGTQAQRGEASSGLGLALAKRIVEAQGGEIRLESKQGEGTTVTFTVPLRVRKKAADK